MKKFLFFLACSFLFVPSLFSLDNSKDDVIEELMRNAPKIFLDCRRCDFDYVRTHVNFVNYVRDRNEAQVHVLVTTERNGSGGREYTFTFIGQKNFVGMNDTLKLATNQIHTKDEIRSMIVQKLKIGLARYAAQTPISDMLNISLQRNPRKEAIRDKWNYWVFNFDTDTDLNGEESRTRIALDGSVSADRVTPELKTHFSFHSEYRENRYDISGSIYKSITRSQRFFGMIVKSITDHWSVGGFTSVNSSIYSNTKLGVGIAPAIEYNYYPYSESTRHELRFLYLLGVAKNKYYEKTIYDKWSEKLMKQELSATFEIKDKWGSISTTLRGSHYFHDFSKNKLQFNTYFSLRLFEGLSLRVRGRISRIHDQLALSSEGASEEEILLHRKELATQYNYSISIGVGYTFGSIYSNVVNPRFVGS
ncbi:MAG: hypothetical protein GXO74_02875 [Calditrichaeota bacterium]|nr:hypothetical protein [Calditrichota bacterium]